MTLDELSKLIENDSVIDKNELDEESLKISVLHTKYYSLMIAELRVQKALEIKYHDTKKERTNYYMGKAPDEAYQEEPLDIRILKADLDLYLDSDTKLNGIKLKLENQRMKVQMLDAFIRAINQRSFNIRNAVEFLKFKNGIS